MAEATLKGKVILDLSQFEKSIKKMELVSKNLNKLFEGLTLPEFKPAVTGAKKLESTFKKTTQTMRKGTKNMQNNLEDMSKVLLALASTKIATDIGKSLINFGRDAVATNADIKTTMKTMGVVFGDTAGEIEDFAQRSSGALGASKKEARELAKSTGIMLRDIGLNKEDTTKLTKQMMVTAGILSQNTGKAMGDVQDAIQSALMGNTITMDKYGIELKESALEMTDAFKKLSGGKSFRELDNNTQGLIRAFAIMEKTTRNYGDELGTTLNAQLASTGAHFKNFSDNMKEAFGEVMGPIVSVINKMAQGLETLSEVFKNLDPSTRATIGAFIAFTVSVPAVLGSVGGLIKLFKYLSASIIEPITKLPFLSKAMLGTAFKIAGGLVFSYAIINECFGGVGNAAKNMGDVVNASTLYMAGSLIKTFALIARAAEALINVLFGRVVTTFGSRMNAFGDAMINTASKLAGGIKAQGKTQNKVNKITNTGEKATKGLTDAQDKNAKSAEKAGEANKKLLDNLQGFDEINKLQVDDGGAGGMDTAIPNMSLPDIGGMGMDLSNLDTNIGDVTSRLAEMQEKFKDLLPYIAGIGFLTLAGKALKLAFGLSKGVKALTETKKAVEATKEAVTTTAEVVETAGLAGKFLKIADKAVGIGAVAFAIGTVGIAITETNKAVENGTTGQETAMTTLASLSTGLAVAGGAIAVGATAATGGIAGVVGALAVASYGIVAHNKNAKQLNDYYFNIEEQTKRTASAQELFTNTLSKHTEIVDYAKGAQDRLKQAEAEAKITGEELDKRIADGTINVKDMSRAQMEVYKRYKENENAQKLLKQSTENLIATDKENKRQKELEGLQLIANKGDWKLYKEEVIKAYNEQKLGSDDAQKMMSGALSKMSRDARKTYVEDIPDDIKKGLDVNKFQGTWDNIKDGFARVGESIKSAFSGATNWIQNKWNKLRFNKNVNVNANGNVPQFATGGLVKSRPGGILANIGEGMYDEAVVPLGGSPQFAEIKQGIASAVIGALGGVSGGTQRIEVDILAGGKYMQKKYIDLTNGVEEYAW